MQSSAEGAELIATGIRVVDWLIFALLLAVALLGGLNALCVDKAFGGSLDVLTALAWGFGSAAVSGVLAGAASNLRRVRTTVE